MRLTPKGGRDAIEGWWQDSVGQLALKARVSAPPEDGKANAALIDLLAKALSVRKADVRIASCAASRFKTIEIDGDDREISARLEEALRK